MVSFNYWKNEVPMYFVYHLNITLRYRDFSDRVFVIVTYRYQVPDLISFSDNFFYAYRCDHDDEVEYPREIIVIIFLIEKFFVDY